MSAQMKLIRHTFWNLQKFLRNLNITFWRVAFFVVNSLFATKQSISPIRDEILRLSAMEIARRIRRRELTSEQVVRAFLRRIDEVNPLLNCVVECQSERAIEEAKRVDSLIRSGKAPSEADAPFLGVPYSMKDSIMAKGWRCTCGIPARRDLVMTEDTDNVERMRSAGAILLAITNVPEVCMWWETNNSIYGRTNNPYDTRRTVGGSSGGEACLQTVAGCPFGIGSDIGGSIRIPAFFNGIFGHKPSPGVVSVRGGIPRPSSGYELKMLGRGPMCRFSEDLAPVLRVLSGEDAECAAKLLEHFDEAKSMDFVKMKIFYMEGVDAPGVSWTDDEMTGALRKVVRYFEQTYGTCAYKIDIPAIHTAMEILGNDLSLNERGSTFTVEMMDGKGDLNPHSELARWLVGRSKHTLPALLYAIFERNNAVSPQEKSRLIAEREKLKHELNTLLLHNEAVFLFPSQPMVAPFHSQPLCQSQNVAYTGIFNSLTLPVTQCPLGLNASGLPLGVQVVAPLFRDAWSIAVACELEKARIAGWVEPGSM